MLYHKYQIQVCYRFKNSAKIKLFPVSENFEFCYICSPFFVRLCCIEISFQLVISCCFWPEMLIFLFLFADNRMNPKFLHNSMNPVLTVAGMVEMIDPACHPPISKNMTKHSSYSLISSANFIFSASCFETDRCNHL